MESGGDGAVDEDEGGVLVPSDEMEAAAAVELDDCVPSSAAMPLLLPLAPLWLLLLPLLLPVTLELLTVLPYPLLAPIVEELLE